MRLVTFFMLLPERSRASGLVPSGLPLPDGIFLFDVTYQCARAKLAFE